MSKIINVYFPSSQNPVMKPWQAMSDVERIREINRLLKGSRGKAAPLKRAPIRSVLQLADIEQLVWFSPEMIALSRDSYEAIRLGLTATANRNSKPSANST